MEGKLQRNRKEMDNFIEEKNGLIVELQGWRNLLENARAQCDTLQGEYGHNCTVPNWKSMQHKTMCGGRL